MLKTRIIPIIYSDGEYCVKTTKFSSVRRLGPIDQYVFNMANRDIDELIIIDINATKKGREPDFERIKNWTEKLFCPVTYGGGISNLDHISKLIQECGVDKVAIKTNYDLISDAAKKFGSQAIIYSMDCYNHHSNGSFFLHQLPKSYGLRYWSRIIRDTGAGEILLTSMDKQGQQKGYSKSLITTISDINVPLIANGGCGSIIHMIEAVHAGANAIAASTVFALTGLTPRKAAEGLHAAGIPVRLDPKEIK